MVRTLKIYSLSKLEIQNTILMTITTMLYIRFSEFAHLITEGLYPFTNIPPFLTPTPALETTIVLNGSKTSTLLDFTYKGDHKLFVCVWLILLSMTSPRFIYVLANGRIFLILWLNNIPPYTYHNFFIQSSADRYLGCFHILANVNNASANTGVHIAT